MLSENLKRTNKPLNLLKDTTYNAIVDALKEKPLTQSGMSFADRQVATKAKIKKRNYFFFKAPENLIERSVFGVTQDFAVDFNDPCIISAQKINSHTDASPFGLFTNIFPYNINDSYGICKAIDYYEPTLLYVSDVEHTPFVGMPCGPDIITEDWGISSRGYGLLCISNVNIDSSGDSFFNSWCIRTHDPTSVIGTIYQNDVAAYNPTLQLLGQGYIQLQYKTSTNTLVNAIGPDGNPLVLPVYNASASSTFKAGTLVKCICVTNVGLVIIDQTNLVYGFAASGIKHGAIGQILAYSGTPGEEQNLQKQYVAFNKGTEVVKNEWCYLTPTGDKTVPYYIVQNEYNGLVLGKAHNDIIAPDDVSGDQIDIWGGDPGGETTFNTNITARLKSVFGAITKNSWVISAFLGPDENGSPTNPRGGWYTIAAQRGLIYAGKVDDIRTAKDYPVDSTVKVRIYTGNGANTDSGLKVSARILYGPVMNLERVQIEWNGDEFIITKGELDGGFEAKVLQDITKGGTGYVYLSPAYPGSEVVIDSIEVFSNLGAVSTGKIVNVFRNRAGWRIVSAEC